MADAQTAIDIAKKWVLAQQWDVDTYHYALSEVQSAPIGFVSVDVMKKEGATNGDESPPSIKTLLTKSRVLEIDPHSGVVDSVLAARDMSALKRLLAIEHARLETERMEEALQARQQTRSDDD